MKCSAFQSELRQQKDQTESQKHDYESQLETLETDMVARLEKQVNMIETLLHDKQSLQQRIETLLKEV